LEIRKKYTVLEKEDFLHLKIQTFQVCVQSVFATVG